MQMLKQKDLIVRPLEKFLNLANAKNKCEQLSSLYEEMQWEKEKVRRAEKRGLILWIGKQSNTM